MRRLLLIAVLVAAPMLMLTSCNYRNCVSLNGVYPHGLGRPGAVDHVRGSTRPVTNFAVNAALYAENRSHDADGDGIACEKR